jgi:hypothetical protein
LKPSRRFQSPNFERLMQNGLPGWPPNSSYRQSAWLISKSLLAHSKTEPNF